jgi:hypothetical protein
LCHSTNPTLSIPIQCSAQIFSQSNKARERNKREVGKKEVKISVLADNMIPYLKDTKDSTTTICRPGKHLGKVAKLQNQQRKISSMYIYKEKPRKQYIHSSHKK